MTTVIIAIVVVILLLWVKAKLASKKSVENRSSLDTILVSLFVMGKKNLDETANMIRTPEISKEEALQKTKTAIAELNNDFSNQVRSLTETKLKIAEVILPTAKKAPGRLVGQAQAAKKKMEKAQAEGKLEVAEVYKRNAVQYLAMKKNALERIEKCEKTLRDIEVNIELSTAEFEYRRNTLEDVVIELESTVTSSISAAKFNSNMEIINSLRRETADKLRQQNAAIEANRIVSSSDTSSVGSFSVNENDFLDELNNL